MKSKSKKKCKKNGHDWDYNHNFTKKKCDRCGKKKSAGKFLGFFQREYTVAGL